MFSYDTGILKSADRLQQALDRVTALADDFRTIAAPHTHELVRLKETEAMLLAARFVLGASLYRTESRLSHFREDHDLRDDTNWLVWVDITEGGNGPSFDRTPIPTPYCSVTLPRRKPSRLAARASVGGV
jgi:succinate dehydrogenase/fumarate reductase flavoprotein subunit